MDNAYGAMGISEYMLQRQREQFGGVQVSPIKAGLYDVLVADGRAFEAWYQATDEPQVVLHAPQGCTSFRVAFVVFPGSGDISIFGPKTISENLDIDIAREYYQGVSEVGELFTVSNSAAHGGEAFNSVSRVTGPELILQGTLNTPREDALPDTPE